jgi:hypothetical protein
LCLNCLFSLDNAGIVNELNYATVTTISNAECQLSYGNTIFDTMVCVAGNYNEQGRSKGGGQVGPAHPRILLAHPRIKVKHIKNKIHLHFCSIYLSSVCGLKSGPPQQKIIATPLKKCYVINLRYVGNEVHTSDN